MKTPNLLKICILLLIFPTITKAIEIEVPKTTKQGSTLEIKIHDPLSEIESISGTFSGETIEFYQTNRTPLPQKKIYRKEFLNLIQEHQPKSSINKPQDTKQKNKHQNTTITRGEAAQILIQSFHPPQKKHTTPTFPDLPKTHPHYHTLIHALQSKIFEGYPDGHIRPDRPITIHEAEIITKRVSPKKLIKKEFKRPYHQGLIGISRLKAPGQKPLTLTIHYQNKPAEQKIINIPVQKREFETVSFSLPVSQKKLFGGKKQNNTWDLINQARQNTSPEKLWEGAFLIPTKGIPTLGYGDLLHINGKYNGSHFGQDYANDEGTKIHASNTGKVVLATNTPSYGNTIIIDHGQHIFTMYLHLSERLVTEGQSISKGELIGLMGKTGIATGSHLHYSHWVGEVIVDGEEWFEKEY